MGWIPEKMRTAAQGICVAAPIAVTAAVLGVAPAQAAYAPKLDVTIDPSSASTPTALTATVSQGAGEDPTRTVALTVPAGFALNLGGAACSGGQEAAFACPEGSRVGIASLATPAGGLSGNIYFGGASGARSKLVLLLSDGAPLFPRAATFEGFVEGSQIVVDGLSATALTLRFAGAPRAFLQTPAQCGPQPFLGHFVSETGAQADSRSTVSVDGCVQLPPQISAIAVSPRIARAGRQATLRFSLTEDAAVEVRLRRAGRKREKTLRKLDGHAGANRLGVATRRLRRGTYLLTVQATDPTGLSRTKTTRLRIVPA